MNTNNHVQLLETPGQWQAMKVAGVEPSFSFKDTSDWANEWGGAWVGSALLGIAMSAVFLAFVGASFIACLSAAAFALFAAGLVPAVEISDGLRKHSYKLQEYANSLSNEWLVHKQRGHGVGEDLQPYSTYGVDIIEDKPERYQLLEFRLQDGRGQYRIIADVTIAHDLTIAAEQGVEIAAMAKSMEEEAAAHYEKLRYSMEIDQAIKDEIELSKEHDEETRQYVIRSAVGKNS